MNKPNKKGHSGETPELVWSLHKTGGWKTQYSRVQRWYTRTINAKNESDKNDFLYAFFENAFHLRDWLTDTLPSKKTEVLNFYNNTDEMMLCRDLAISHKHHSINSPSLEYPPSEQREYIPRNNNFGSRLFIIINGQKVFLQTLATEIMLKLDEFITQLED